MLEIHGVVEDAARRIDVTTSRYSPTGPGWRFSQGIAAVISWNAAVERRVARLGSKASTRSRRTTGAGTRAASRYGRARVTARADPREHQCEPLGGLRI